jgi:hypothetical protein
VKDLLSEKKPENLKIGSVAKLPSALVSAPISSKWKVSAVDLADDDLIDESSLLEGLPPPPLAPPSSSCGVENEGKKRACKNCSCGLAGVLPHLLFHFISNFFLLRKKLRRLRNPRAVVVQAPVQRYHWARKENQLAEIATKEMRFAVPVVRFSVSQPSSLAPRGKWSCLLRAMIYKNLRKIENHGHIKE